jgi:APAF-1 helical domain
VIRLHDVFRAYLAGQLGQPAAAVAHARLVDSWGDPRRLPDAYAWRWIGYHLVGAGRTAELRLLLTDFDWLQAKLDATGIALLLSDFALASVPEASESEPVPLRLVYEVVRLSAYVLAQDRTQLAGQLCGRPGGRIEEEIRRLLERARAWRGAPWLQPLTASLLAPGGPLLHTLTHRSEVEAVAVSVDWRELVSGAKDGTVKVWNLAYGTERLTLPAHAEGVSAVALTRGASARPLGPARGR